MGLSVVSVRRLFCGKGERVMNISTKFFGDVDVDEAKIIVFQQGIVGFPDAIK